ncbi:MAG: MarR family transcriptional regulator [Cycloclasticus sp.]
MSTPQDMLGFLLADVSRMMRRAFNKHLEGSSLTLAQARALVYAARHEGIRQSHLAEMLEILPITLTRLIDQLVEDGFVERRPDPNDRRAHQIFITKQAPPILNSIKQTANAIQADALTGLDEQQASQLLSALQTMRDNLGAD